MLTCAHTAWKSTSACLLFCTSGKERVENLKIARGQLAPYQEKRIKRQKAVSSAGCKVLAANAGFLLASMPSYCPFKPIECSYSDSVSVSVPHDKIRGSAILSEAGNADEPDWPKDECPRQTIGPLANFVHYIAAFPIFANTVDVKRAQ